MGMNVGSSGAKGADPEPMMEMNMTPLIDVMLVLIIMMIITIPKQNHSVNLNMPVGTPPPQTKDPVVITIDVDFDGGRVDVLEQQHLHGSSLVGTPARFAPCLASAVCRARRQPSCPRSAMP